MKKKTLGRPRLGDNLKIPVSISVDEELVKQVRKHNGSPSEIATKAFENYLRRMK